MVNFKVNVVSEKEDKRIPVAIAGQVMVDIQDMFRHVGEYLISREMRLQEMVPKDLSNKFTLYVDRSGGLSIDASSYTPDTEGYGNIVEDAVALLESTLDALGSGKGGYWVDDNFKDALYRNQVVIDAVALYQDLADYEGFALMYGTGSELKKFGNVDVQKMAAFINERGLTSNGVTIGVIEKVSNKSKIARYALNNGTDSIRLTFPSDEETKKAILIPGPVILAGTLIYSEEGKIAAVENAYESSPLALVKFRRVISTTGDVILKTPVEVKVAFDGERWTLSNSDLGILISKGSWDETVRSFHDYFMFLWNEYTDKDESALDEEGKEVKESLLKLVA